MFDLLTTYPRLMVLGGLLLAVATIALADPNHRNETSLGSFLGTDEPNEETVVEYEDRLLALDSAIRTRLQIKEYLLCGLIEGDATLEYTAGQFIALQLGDLKRSGNALRKFRGDTELERSARQVIALVSARLNKDKNTTHAALRDRLNCELETLIGD